MRIKETIETLEKILRELSEEQKRGLDTSSLKLFIKNLKMYEKIQTVDKDKKRQEIGFEEKLDIIKSFLEDRKAFPSISDVIGFANSDLQLEFKDQKESRETTIKRVILRIKQKPELKEKVKESVQKIRNEKVHSPKARKSKKEVETTATFMQWAEILKDL